MQVKVLIVLLSLALSGCAVHQNFDSDPQVFSELPAAHGVVVFQVASLDQRVNKYMPEWFALRARRIGGGPMAWLEEGEKAPLKYIVYPDFRQIPGTTLWVGVLPAGDYVAEDLFSSFNAGNVYGHMSAPILDRFSTFRIEPDRVTLLDTYLTKTMANSIMIANSESPDDLLAAARDAYPEIMSEVSTDNPLRFSDSLREDSEAAYDEMLRWAETQGLATFASDGRIYRPARAGQVFERLPDGKWRRLTLDTLERVDTVWAGSDGEMIAVTQGGRAFHRTAENGGISERVLPFGDARLQRLHRRKDGSWIATTVTTDIHEEPAEFPTKPNEMKRTYFHSLQLWKSQRLDATQWQQLVSMEVDNPSADATTFGDHAIVYRPGDRSVRVNLESGKTRHLRHNIHHVRKYSNNTALSFNGDELLITRDDGLTWREIDDIEPNGMPALLGDGSILAIGQREHRTLEEVHQSKKHFRGFLELPANSEKWKSAGDVPEGCSGWLELKETKKGTLLLCEYKAFFRLDHSRDWLPEDMRGLEDHEMESELADVSS